MMRLLPSLVVLLAFAGWLVGCGDDGESEPRATEPQETAAGEATGEPEADVVEVTSDDGKLTLRIPRAGLADASIGITATAVPLEELPEELQVLQGAGTGYRLEPSGLELSEPAEAVLTLDAAEAADVQTEGGLTTMALVSLDGAGVRSLLPGNVTEGALPLEGLAVRGEIDHFSYLGRTKGSITFALEGGEGPQVVGEPFTVALTMSNSNTTGEVILEEPMVTTSTEGALAPLTGGGSVGQPLPPGQSLTPLEDELACTGAGTGTYRVEGGGTTVVEVAGETNRTPLRIVLTRTVECVGALD